MSNVLASVKEIEQNCHLIEFSDGSRLFLIGTAHISISSVELVERIIRREHPDVVCIELDENRLALSKEEKGLKDVDIVSLLRGNRFLFFVLYLLLSSFQKKLAREAGAKLGGEFEKARELSEEFSSKLCLIDREANITIKRAWNTMPFFSQLKLIFSFFFWPDDKNNDVTQGNLEILKQSENVLKLVREMEGRFPILKRVIIDERDTYMAKSILEKKGEVTVAVVGAGHVEGMIRNFESDELPSIDLRKLEHVPRGSRVWKYLMYSIPVFIVVLFVYGLIFGDRQEILSSATIWILVNGFFSFFGSLLAAAHPLTLISAFVFAPITTLTPLLGVGVITALVQFFVVKPRVSDIESVNEDIFTFSKWWKNRFLRVILVFVLSSLGAAAGMFVSTYYIVHILHH